MVDGVSYLGSKAASGAVEMIVAQMPPHDVFIDAFAGTCAVLRRKPRAARDIAVEIDARTLADFPPPTDVEIVQEDCRSYIAGFDYARSRTLIYADPPYVQATRSAKRYRHDFSDEDHRELIALLRSVPAAVMLSGYPSALYDELLADWRCLTFQAMTRGGVRTECLWMNFPAGAVHWASFAGRNFTDRQRIKRKASRWAAKFRVLPPAERTAVLAAILDVATDGNDYAAAPPAPLSTPRGRS